MQVTFLFLKKIMSVINQTTLKKWVQPVGWILLYLLAWGYCQYYFAYDYFYAEQFEFFRFSGDYAADTLSQWGGLSTYLAAFLLQFFLVPYVGAAVSALLFVGIGWTLRGVWLRMAGTVQWPLLYLLPSLLLLWAGTDFAYRWAGTVGLWLALACLYLCLWPKSFRIRTVCMALLFVPGCYLIGPWMWVAAWGVLLSGLARRRWVVGWLLPWCVLWMWLFYYQEAVPEWRFLLTPDAYYHPKLSFPVIGWYVVAACLLNLLLAAVWGRCRFSLRTGWKWALVAVQGVLLLGLWAGGTSRFYFPKNRVVKQLDYHARLGQWQQMLEVPGLRAGANFLHACYQNYALAALGRLGDDVLDYPQCGTRGLVLAWDRSNASSMLLSDIHYLMGDIALSQEMAFEGMIASVNGMTPRLLLRLVQTNLIYGYDAVAEKYIRLLEQTWGYASQATHYRQFLYHPERLAEDAELGARKRCIGQTSGLTNDNQTMDNLLQVMHSNPSWRPAFLYYGTICLLNKDVKLFRSFIEGLQDAPGLQPLPDKFQEAVILLHEHDEEAWRQYKVTPEVAARFKAYRQAVYAFRKGQLSMVSLREHFGHTYWFYYMFNR